jgi:hypothetical protein
MRQALCDNKRMQAWAAPASPSYLAGRGARRACLLLASCWALTGAAFGARVFQSWWTHPVPVFNPLTDGPVPDDFHDSVLGVLFLAVLMAVALAGLQVATIASGFAYLRGTGLSGRWRTAWACAVIAAAAVGVAFIGVFWQMRHGQQTVLGHPSWGLLAFSAAFLIAGAVMVAIITAAARQARRQAMEA